MRKIVERSLCPAGDELEKVTEASNGAEALAALPSNVVDLILCNINMPVMDGLEFVRQVGTVESAKGVDIVNPRPRTGDPSTGAGGKRGATPAATLTTPLEAPNSGKPSAGVPPKPAAMKAVDTRLKR